VSDAAHAQLSRLMDGYLVTQLLYVAARLGIADAFADGPRAADVVAGDIGVEPRLVRRVLRGLAAEGMLDEHPDGRFSLTAVGSCLRRDVASSLRGAILARGDLYYPAAAGLLDAVRQGGSAFEHVHGTGFFDFLSAHPDHAARFHTSMADRARREAADIVAAYDFSNYRRLVDVGGGEGILLEAILTATPQLQAVLFDRQSVVEGARDRLATVGLADRCEVVAGDFLANVPAGADVYMLSRVIHNWDDDAAVRILTNCHRAMAPAGTLLLADVVLPTRAADHPAAIRMDLHMLTLLRGRERTADEQAHLLGVAGFGLARIVPTGSPTGISVIEAAAAG
jgi:SAM-dependent methyltransferase